MSPTNMVVIEGQIFLFGGISTAVHARNIARSEGNWSLPMNYTHNAPRLSPSHAVIGNKLVVAGGLNNNRTTIDVLDVVTGDTWTCKFDEPLPNGAQSVTAGNMTLFYHPRDRTLFRYDLRTNSTSVIEKQEFAAATSLGSCAYFIDRRNIVMYNYTSNEWSNFTLRRPMRLHGASQAFMVNETSILMVTERNTMMIDLATFNWTVELESGSTSPGVLHNNVLYLFSGPSRLLLNTIFTYDLDARLRGSTASTTL